MKKPCRECKHYEKCCKDAGFCDAQWERAYNIRDGKDCWVEREKDATQWISVKDRLPKVTDPPTYVLFITKTGQQYVGYYHKGVTTRMFDGFFCFGIQYKNTTHWMPLPEPPKGE